MHPRAKELIENLSLVRHPEGGYFFENYRSSEIIAKNALPKRYSGERCFCTSIFFLLEGSDVSKLHKIRSDEIWHFYEGTPLVIVTIDESGFVSQLKLGEKNADSYSFMTVIPQETWMGAYLSDSDGYALVGCTVAPGFDFDDFLLADREIMQSLFPKHMQIIENLL